MASGVSSGSVPAPPADDEWVAEAVRSVEASITRLADEFRLDPFLHRVEHSLHVRLVQLLSEWENLRGLHPIGQGKFRTQLIHKEWPESKPRMKLDLTGDRRRGSFDIAVLAPRPVPCRDPGAVHRGAHHRSYRDRTGFELLGQAPCRRS